MRNELDFPSVEDRDDDIEADIPALDLDWNDWWKEQTTITALKGGPGDGTHSEGTS